MAESDTERKFRILKSDLSKCFDGDRYFWLRFLLFDLLGVGDVTNQDYIGNDLFNSLEEKGLITPKSVKILLEITELSEVKQAKDLVRKYMMDNEVGLQDTTETNFTTYRKRMFKVMKQINPNTDEFKELNSSYKLTQYKFSNVWDLVLKLEIGTVLADEPAKIQRFADCLGEIQKEMLFDYGNSVKDGNELSTHQSQTSEELSEDEFRQLIADFAEWYEANGFFHRLKVLFIEIIGDVEAYENVNNITDLLALLIGPGLLGRTNLSILYDTIKVTKQWGFQSDIKQKLSPFYNIENREVVSFPPHTLSIYDLGKQLRNNDIKTLDGRFNFPRMKKYTDSWNLILDLECRGLLKDDKIESIKKSLKK